MSRTIRLTLLAGCLFSVGCRDAPAPQVGDALPAESVATPSAHAVAASNATEAPATPDLSIPRLAPRPVVWADDWKSPAAASTARRAAEQLMEMADQLKAFEEYTDAEKYYRQAMDADPAWTYPAYQLACNYELSGQHERAAAMYAQAVELGFDDFPTALGDDELGQIRNRPDFPATLAAIRERYIAASDERVGQPIAVRAQGERTAAGRPLMLLLHGYGDSNLSYLDQAEQWAARGFIAVAVPGPVVRLWSAACRRAGWRFDSRTHPGGHHFPDDWDQQLPGIASFLLE